MRLYAGQQLGQYVLDYSLGAGGMAAVWAATHRILGVQVAVKVLFSGNPVLQDRLLREGRAQAAMVHPNILPVRDVIDVAGHLGLVLPLVRGPSLDKLLQAYRPTLAEAVGVFREIVEGVRYAHERGLIHRDLKPGNVLLEEQRSQIVPLVADFGLVKGTAEPGMTQTHAVMGTLRYAAPEQLLDASSVDLRADLFSLGVLFVELLTGTPPFQGSSLQALLDAYQQAPELRGVPAPFAPLCRHLLAHAADQRPSDCGEVLERLNAVHPQPAVAVLGLASGLARAMRARPVADAVVPDTNASQTRDLSGTFSESLFEAFGTAETAPPKNNLPAALDTFIGRETELAQLTEQLANSRLITVTGAGGIGKTRFVLQFSHQNRSSFPGGVFFCDLSEARDLEGIVFVVSQAMDIPLGRGDHLKQLGHAIAAHGRCLLVLDNFEQIAAFAPGTVERWLKEAPEARFVVTSRVLLEVSGEQTCRLQPLTEDAAVWMFVHRAQNKKRTFRLTDGNRDAVLQLVRQLDCLPLAIELACARIGIMTPEVMVKRMSRRFQLLASGKRNTAHRQATLRAAIDWSWALLEDWEKDAFAQCSVFEGGFTLEAAEAIIALDDDAPWPMDAIQSLVDKSLLRPLGEDPMGSHRFGMLMSLQAYAREKLEAMPPDAVTACRWRHLQFFAHFGELEALDALNGFGGDARWWTLSQEIENLRAANRFAVDRGTIPEAVQTARALYAIAYRQHPSIATPALHATLQIDGIQDAPMYRASALSIMAILFFQQGQHEASDRHFTEAIQIAQQIGDRRSEGSWKGNLAVLRMIQGQMDAAEQLYLDGLQICRDIRDRRGEGRILSNLGSKRWNEGRFNDAEPYIHEALKIAREVGNRVNEGVCFSWLASIHTERGQLKEAEQNRRQAMHIARVVGDRRSESSGLGSLGVLMMIQGRWSEAERLFRRAHTIAREIGNRRFEGPWLGTLGLLSMKRGQMETVEANFTRAHDIAREVGDRRHEAIWLGHLGHLRRHQRRWEDAKRIYQDALDRAQKNNDQSNIGIWKHALGRLHREQGDTPTAEHLLTEALAIATKTHTQPLKSLCLGELGRLWMTTGREDDGRLALVDSETQLRAMHSPFELGLLLCHRAAAEHLVNNPDDAAAALHEATQIATDLDLGTRSELSQQIVRVGAILNSKSDA